MTFYRVSFKYLPTYYVFIFHIDIFNEIFLQFQKNPLLIRIETKAGHGAGKPMTKVIEEGTDKYAFLTQALGYVYKDL